MKSILTVECYKLTKDDGILEADIHSIEISGWLYTFYPMRYSLFDCEMMESLSVALEYLFDDVIDLHVEMQRLIAENKFRNSQFSGHYVIDLLTDEKTWKEEDNWTGPGEWIGEIDYCGVANLEQMGVQTRIATSSPSSDAISIDMLTAGAGAIT